MTKHDKTMRDVFALSLGGMTTISSFVIAPAIADDRLNQVRDARRSKAHEDQPSPPRDDFYPKGRFWLSGRRRTA